MTSPTFPGATAQIPAHWAIHLTALALVRPARTCPHCGQPRRIILDDGTLPVTGLRLAACDCTGAR